MSAPFVSVLSEKSLRRAIGGTASTERSKSALVTGVVFIVAPHQQSVPYRDFTPARSGVIGSEENNGDRDGAHPPHPHTGHAAQLLWRPRAGGAPRARRGAAQQRRRPRNRSPHRSRAPMRY